MSIRSVAIIPARGGSAGIYQKNLRPLGGRPLIEHTIRAAMGSALDRVVVSTDNSDIAACARALGIETYNHPPMLSTADARTFPVIQWALAKFQQENGEVEVCATLRATTPFRSATDIDNALKLFANTHGADSIVSLVELAGAHPKRLKEINDGFLVDSFQSEGFFPLRRQELTPVFIRNGGLYASSPGIIEKGGLWGPMCLGYVMPPERSVNINTEFDFHLAELLFASLSESDKY